CSLDVASSDGRFGLLAASDDRGSSVWLFLNGSLPLVRTRLAGSCQTWSKPDSPPYGGGGSLLNHNS
ncbi:unnamed protein product, partial [Amoebophrya sp. A25]